MTTAERAQIVEALILEERRRWLEQGVPILDEEALADRVRASIARAEAAEPAFLAHARARMAAQERGERLTFCRLVRGSHGGTHVYDPEGTDEPPPGWSVAVARRASRRRAPAVGAPVPAAGDADATREAVSAILRRLRTSATRSEPADIPGTSAGRPRGPRVAVD